MTQTEFVNGICLKQLNKVSNAVEMRFGIKETLKEKSVISYLYCGGTRMENGEENLHTQDIIFLF